jgi:pseudouridine-5'-phosphate glycosidase
MNPWLDVSESVAEALAAGKPVVALESTIISHGMPYPRNLETALRVEAEVERAGATPATIAIIDGRLKAGLSREHLEYLAKRGREVAKASRRDIAGLVARGETGATTVASTMIVAELAGIRIFATGGIGGVHRGAESNFDVSADLQELARTSVCVICAGAKSILDLAKTLEYLETMGVPVLGYGTSELPAFYTRESGLKLEERADSPGEVATLIRAKWDLGLAGGIVVTNPIPKEFSLDRGVVDTAIDRAIADAAAAGVGGKELTPFLLARVEELTGGTSLDSNIELVLNNARLAAQIAVSYAALR